MEEIKSLEYTEKQEIVDCLHEAFSDYAIPMKMPFNYWIDRWEMACIDYSLSYGFFEDQRLCGFVLHGLDQWGEKYVFYNMATGVIPDSRGKRVVARIYDEILPHLRKANCTHGCLEVLCKNEKAIKAYRSSGFEIRDQLLSYHLPSNLETREDTQLVQVENWHPGKYDPLKSHFLSFEHRDEIIARNPRAFTFLELQQSGKCIAYAVLKSSNNNIIQFGFENSSFEYNAENLFAHIKIFAPGSRLININTHDHMLVEFFKSRNFGQFIEQYSMFIEL